MEDLNVKQMMLAAKNIAAEKNLPEEKVLEVIEMAIAAAWRRENGNRDQNVRAELNTETGDAEVFVQFRSKMQKNLIQMLKLVKLLKRSFLLKLSVELLRKLQNKLCCNGFVKLNVKLFLRNMKIRLVRS